MSNKFTQGWLGLWFHYDNDISIYWNRAETFTIYDDSKLPRKEINCFTVEETLTPKQAELIADEWLEEQIEEEKLKDADIFHNEEDMEFQFHSPDLFKM
tara:strand:+ start:304 stop:600 length:297 start_codon:yes stop_codon:yes gene_type:complete